MAAFAAATVTLALLQLSVALATPLKSEFSIKLSNLPKGLAWSPDSRHIALAEGKSNRVHLLSTDTHALVDKGIRWQAYLLPSLSWSADSASLIVVGHDVALFSMADGQELARAKILSTQCDSRMAQRAAYVSASNLWLACGQIREQKSSIAALALNLPGLQQKDVIEGAAPADGYRNSFRASRIEQNGDAVFLTTLFNSCIVDSKMGSQGCDPYAACIELESRASCFKPFSLEPDGVGGQPVNIGLLASRRLIVSQWRFTETFRNGPFDFAFEVHDFDGRRLTRLGFHSDRQGLDVRDFQVTNKGLLIAALADEPKNKGGIAVWDIDAGKLLQFIPTSPAAFAKLSFDETKLAVATDEQVLIFSISGN